MTAFRILLSLLPWVVFSLLAQRDGAQATGIAALGAVAVGALLMARNRSGGVKLVDVTAVLCFGTIFVSAFAGQDGTREWLADYGRAASTLVLAAVLMISAGTVPFTEAYAKEVVPRQQWATPGFRSVNRRVSALWSLVVLLMGIGHLLVGSIDPVGNDKVRWADLLLNWLLVVLLVLIGVTATRLLTRPAADGPQTSVKRAVGTGLAPRAD
ncbi:MAG: hypothetical protein ABWZ98_13515 [Nakamurella sp.]